MRRKEREITDTRIIEQLLKEGTICRLALFDGNEPYIVPLNYGYKEHCLYFHSAPGGRKIEILERNPYVCFEIEGKVEVVGGERSCDYTTHYRSVIGYGNIEMVRDVTGLKQGLDIIMAQHGKPENNSYEAGYFSKMMVLKLPIERITCKQNGNW